MAASLDRLRAMVSSHLAGFQSNTNNNGPYVFVTFDIEQGRDRSRQEVVTEIGLSAITLKNALDPRGTEFTADGVIAAFTNKHYRVVEHGGDWFSLKKYCGFAGTKAEFAQSEWISKKILTNTLMSDLRALRRNGGHGHHNQAKLVFFAWDLNLERRVFQQLGIDLNTEFINIFDTQRLALYSYTGHKSQPALDDMTEHYNVNDASTHNGVNDAVYESFILMNLIFERAMHAGAPLIQPGFTAAMNLALERIRVPHSLTSEVLLPHYWPRGSRCNNCGIPSHDAADCRMYCIICSGYHASTDKKHHGAGPPATSLAKSTKNVNPDEGLSKLVINLSLGR